MARVKQSVVQRDFSLMELREDFLDADAAPRVSSPVVAAAGTDTNYVQIYQQAQQ